MNTATRITTTMIVALAMIGMLSGIGAAIPTASSYMDYNVDFDGSGDGHFNIWTNTPAGNDFMRVNWANSATNGHQDGNSYDGWTEINRDATIKGNASSGVASGTIYTRSEMLSGDYTPASVTAYAGYYDDDVGGSYVTLEQSTILEDNDATPNTGCDGIGTGVTIYGYAYGNDSTHVRGDVSSVTDGMNNVSTKVGAYVHDGSLNMDVNSGIMDDTPGHEGSGTVFDISVSSPNSRADGYVYGAALIDGVTQPPVKNNTFYMGFSGAANVTPSGILAAGTPSMMYTDCFNLLMDGMESILPDGPP